MLTAAERDASHTADRDGEPQVASEQQGDALMVALAGTWTTRTVADIDAEMRQLEALEPASLRLDLSDVGRLDTAGAWVIDRLVASCEARSAQISVVGGSEAVTSLLQAIRESGRPGAAEPKARRPTLLLRMLAAVGRQVYGIGDDFMASMYILGSTIRGAQTKAGRGHGVNMAAIFNQMDKMGVGAIPVVVLMSAIVGAIVAQQGAFQLSYFGADIFVVDLVGILVLRELGVLMTAIMIAGRSGSAITAEIGSMKMREEVDALTVIGLNPVGVLVFPRLVALVIAVPCLTVLANFAALGGAILVSWLYSDIAPQTFVDRLRISIDSSTFFAGLLKAPFMALIIGIIAAVEGLKVGGSAESLGLHVTASVVKAIFVVVIVDGLFAIFYAQINF